MQDAFEGVVGSILDVFNNWMNVTGLSAVKEGFDNVKSFFDLFGIVADIPNLLFPLLWGPLGVCVIIVVFAAIVNKLLGVIS